MFTLRRFLRFVNKDVGALSARAPGLLLGAGIGKGAGVGGTIARVGGAGRGAGSPAGPRGHASHHFLDRPVLQRAEGLTVEGQLLQTLLHVDFPFRSMKRGKLIPWPSHPSARCSPPRIPGFLQRLEKSTGRIPGRAVREVPCGRSSGGTHAPSTIATNQRTANGSCRCRPVETEGPEDWCQRETKASRGGRSLSLLLFQEHLKE